MKPFGLHLPNDRSLEDFHWDIIKRVQPGIVVVCEPYFADAPRLRQEVPGVVIVGRMYGDQSLGISNWFRPDAQALANMAEFGRRSGHKANQYDLDIVTPFNEPSIDWNLPTTPDGFALIAQVFLDWLAGYRETTQRKAGTIALAPGGREDDDGGWGYRGADILRPAFEQADVLLLHNYWNRGHDTYGTPLVQSEWEGDRARRQLDAYQWNGRPWAITECNRPLKDDSEKAEIAEQSRTFMAQHAAKPGFLGAAWFILDCRDDQFREHRMVNNDALINTAVSINAASVPQEVPAMPIQTVITALSRPVAQQGGVASFSFLAEGIDGTGKGFADIAYPIIPGSQTEERYGPNLTTALPAFFNGQQSVTLNVPPATTPTPGPVVAGITLRIIEIDGVNFDGGAFGAFPIDLIPGVPTPPTPPAPPANTNAPYLHVAYHGLHEAEMAAMEAGDTLLLLEIQQGIAVIDRRKSGDFR